jgi:hypothetical protein
MSQYTVDPARQYVLARIKLYIQSTDHELIPARNAGLATVQGSASGSNVRYYPT